MFVPNAHFYCESKFVAISRSIVAILRSIVAILRYKLRFLLRKNRSWLRFYSEFLSKNLAGGVSDDDLWLWKKNLRLDSELIIKLAPRSLHYLYLTERAYDLRRTCKKRMLLDSCPYLALVVNQIGTRLSENPRFFVLYSSGPLGWSAFKFSLPVTAWWCWARLSLVFFVFYFSVFVFVFWSLLFCIFQFCFFCIFCHRVVLGAAELGGTGCYWLVCPLGKQGLVKRICEAFPHLRKKVAESLSG